MQFTIIPISIFATGMILLSLGLDSLKVAAAGIRFVPVQWVAAATLLSYRTAGFAFAVLGFALMALAADICRRHDNKVVAAIPGMTSPRSFRPVFLGAVIAVVVWTVASNWLRM